MYLMKSLNSELERKKRENREKEVAERYASNDYGLFNAIVDEYTDAIRGLIRFFGHDVNTYVIVQGYSGLKYADYPTPLSYALANRISAATVKLLIELGAKTEDKYALKHAKESQSDEIREIFKLPEVSQSITNKM